LLKNRKAFIPLPIYDFYIWLSQRAATGVRRKRRGENGERNRAEKQMGNHFGYIEGDIREGGASEKDTNHAKRIFGLEELSKTF